MDGKARTANCGRKSTRFRMEWTKSRNSRQAGRISNGRIRHGGCSGNLTGKSPLVPLRPSESWQYFCRTIKARYPGPKINQPTKMSNQPKDDMTETPSVEGPGLAAPPCSQIPNPGSDEAISAGCTCPVYDNARGRGYMCIAGVFVYQEGCPVHSANDQMRDG